MPSIRPVSRTFRPFLSRLAGSHLFYHGTLLLLLLGVLRGIEFHYVSSGNSVSVSVLFRYDRDRHLNVENSKILIKHSYGSNNEVKNRTSLIISNTSVVHTNDSVLQGQPLAACFDASNSTCRVVYCDRHRWNLESRPIINHFRGHVRDVSVRNRNASRPSPVCGVCRTYGFQCAISTQHRFIYIHVMKSGGSSMHLFLKSSLCRLSNSTRNLARPTSRDYDCRSEQFRLMGCTAAISRHPGFFRWSIVRHPVPRAVSGWAMASRRPADGAKLVDFNTWAINTSSLPTRVWAMHWLPQVDFLLDAWGCPMFDFVATMGRGLAGDMEYVLRRINAPGLWAAYRKGGGLPREYATPGRVREAAYQNLSAAAAAALAERYRADLAAFGFRMEGWREDGFF